MAKRRANDARGYALTPEPGTTRTSESSRTIGPFTILRELGRGGQGTVYLAEDTRLRRLVALKVLTSLAGSISPDALRRFRREAEAASKLDHAGIAPVYEAGEADGTPYIAMRYVEGETLAKKIARAKALPGGADGAPSSLALPEAATTDRSEERTPERTPSGPSTRKDILAIVRLIERAARTLHEAHEAGLIHRDIKPGNIMVTPEGQPVLLDFGLARDELGDLQTLTQTGELMGTPAYMSPEQLMAKRVPLNRRTDVYSLGVTLYECLTLRRPFEAPTRHALYQMIFTTDAPDPTRINRAIPQDLRVVIETALEKDRDRRYGTALDFAEELARVARYEPIQARPAGPVLRLRRWTQRNPILATLFLVLSIGLATSLGLLVQVKSERDRANTEKQAASEARQKADENARRADDNAREAQEKTREVLRLSDVKKLADYLAEMDSLWPAVPDRVEPLANWLTKARTLADRLDIHKKTLAALREQSLPWTEDDRKHDRETHPEAAQLASLEQPLAADQAILARADRGEGGDPKDIADARQHVRELPEQIGQLQKMVSERLTWRFTNTETQWQHDTLAGLAAGIQSLCADDASPSARTIRSLEARLEFARTLRKRTIDDIRKTWDEAIASISDPRQCPKYDGLQIEPQLGLVPIERDPASGLWEFAHVASGRVPERGPDGKLKLTEDMGIVFVLLPGGSFTMGSQPSEPGRDRDETQHEVTLDPFFMSKFEMTQAQWFTLMGENPSNSPPGSTWGDKVSTWINPVEQVSWDDCRIALSRLALVLPTEAQWEYAARAGTTTSYWMGNDPALLKDADNVSDAYRKAHGGATGWFYELWDDGFVIHAPVGSFRPNPFGLHDVHGNVGEWCRDGYGGYDLPVAPGDGERAVIAPTYRVSRGGGFNVTAVYARAALRISGSPSIRYLALGVRAARPLGK